MTDVLIDSSSGLNKYQRSTSSQCGGADGLEDINEGTEGGGKWGGGGHFPCREFLACFETPEPGSSAQDFTFHGLFRRIKIRECPFRLPRSQTLDAVPES